MPWPVEPIRRSPRRWHRNLIHRRELRLGDKTNRPDDTGRVPRKSTSRLEWRSTATVGVKSSTVRRRVGQCALGGKQYGGRELSPKKLDVETSPRGGASRAGPTVVLGSVRRIQELVSSVWRNPRTEKVVEGEVNAMNAGPLGTSRRDWVTVSQGRDLYCDTTC